jgi:thiol:disulfide interchange protein DsbC
MKKKLVLFVMFFFLYNSAMAFYTCIDVDINTIKEHIAIIPDVEIVSKKQVFNICQIILKNKKTKQYSPIYVGDGYVLAGDVFSKNVKMSEKVIEGFEKENVLRYKKELEEVVAIEKKPKGKINHILYLITDPLCPHCKHAAKSIIPLIDQYGIHLKIILNSIYPPRSTRKATEAVCKNFTLEDYASDEWANKKDTKENQCSEGRAFINKSVSVIKSIGLRGVPVFIFNDGTRIVGVNMKKLESRLNEMPAIKR